MNDVCFFLPTRKGSKRVAEKNTKPFSSVNGGILEHKLKQLLQVKQIDRVILSTNDEKSVDIANRIDPQAYKIEVIIRPENLCLDSTPLVDLINYVPQIINNTHIIWGHVTTPFVSAQDYDDAVRTYLWQIENGYDSLISITPFQNFLLDPKTGKLFNVNETQKKWPRTQDLPLLYEVNHAMFLTSREVYLTNQDRVGVKPVLYELDKIKSFDIDWEDDFLIAEAIYDKIFKG